MLVQGELEMSIERKNRAFLCLDAISFLFVCVFFFFLVWNFQLSLAISLPFPFCDEPSLLDKKKPQASIKTGVDFIDSSD